MDDARQSNQAEMLHVMVQYMSCMQCIISYCYLVEDCRRQESLCRGGWGVDDLIRDV